MKGFFDEMLVNALGKEKAEQIQSQIKKATLHTEVFASIRSASTDELVLAMEGEHPQTIAVILSELSHKKSQEVLSLLGEKVRLKAVCKMTNPDVLGAGVKQKMASILSERLKGLKGETIAVKPGQQNKNLRKLAIMLSGLEKTCETKCLMKLTNKMKKPPRR
jgi:flagellar motor switch protein FliG